MTTQRSIWATLGWVLLALLAAFALLSQFTDVWEKTHSLLALLLIVGCFLLIRYAWQSGGDGRTIVLTLIWGYALSLCYLVGEGYLDYGRLLPQVHPVILTLRFLGLGLFFASLARAFLRHPIGTHPAPEASKSVARCWFFISWAVMLLCWVPYYLAVYPGVFSVDTMRQFAQAYDLADLDNTHPLVHTLMLKLALSIGDAIGIEYRTTYGLLALFQMIGLSAVFAYAVTLLRKYVRSVGLSILAVVNFALSPHHAFFSMTLWKDIPFSAMVLMLSLMLLKVVISDGKVLQGWGFRIALTITTIAVMLLRNNGIIPVLFTLILMLILWKPNRIFFGVLSGVCLVIYLFLNAFLYPMLEIGQPALTEVISSPMQQVARVAAMEPETLSEEQIDLIEYVIPLDVIAKEYNPRNVDAIKFSPSFYGDGIIDNLEAYARLWLDIVKTHPETAATAHLALTSSFWFPDQIPGTTIYLPNAVTNDWDAELYNETLMPWLAFLVDWRPDLIQRNVPILNLFLLPGVVIWITLLALVCLAAKWRRKFMLVTLPMLGLWACLMFGAPLSDGRYAYAFYLVLPLMLGLCMLSKRQDEIVWRG